MTTPPATPPHAFLQPLRSFILNGASDSESESDIDTTGVMCLVLDRKETKNALSVRMVHVCIEEETHSARP